MLQGYISNCRSTFPFSFSVFAKFRSSFLWEFVFEFVCLGFVFKSCLNLSQTGVKSFSLVVPSLIVRDSWIASRCTSSSSFHVFKNVTEVLQESWTLINKLSKIFPACSGYETCIFMGEPWMGHLWCSMYQLVFNAKLLIMGNFR